MMGDRRKLRADLQHLVVKINKTISELEDETHLPYSEKAASLRHTLSFAVSVINIYSNQLDMV